MFQHRCVVLVVAVVSCSTTAWAQQTGELLGVVRDQQAAVLPGVTVTVSSPALIGGARRVSTGDTGAYQLGGLSPGSYDVTYEHSGFAVFRTEDVVIQVAQTTRVDVELSLATFEQTVIVGRDSPVVDVSSTITQTNVTKQLYEAIPTGRNPWVMAGLVPGVTTGRLDVGGTEGMQQYSLEAFGSADSQKSFSIDGLKTNWGGGAGGSTMQYYGFEMYDEYNIQTASGTAESDVGGVYMNMVTKAGGNRVTSDHVLYFMNRDLQARNIDDRLRSRLGLQPGQRTGAAGNPIDVSYDWSSTIGGPVKRDRVWFFGALRRWRLDQFQIGALNPDGTQAIDDNRIENYVGKVSAQLTATTHASFLFNRNLKYRFHRRDAPYLFVEDKATLLQDQPAQNYVAQLNRVLGTRAVLDVRVGRIWGVFPAHYQKTVSPNDIAVRDSVRLTRINAAELNQDNPNHRQQAQGSVGYFTDAWGAGVHDVKVGTQFSWEQMAYQYVRNGDILLELADGVATRAFLSNTPINSDHRLQTWAAFVQDRWIIDRATINGGFRIDGVRAYLPAQSSPAGTWVGERSFPKRDVFTFSANVAPRVGVSYDLFGNGRTALKTYYGRFYNQFGSELAESSNPNALVSLQAPWSDTNGNLRADPGELNLSTFSGFTPGVFPPFDPDARRPHSDEFNVGIDHQLMQSLGVSASYHRRWHRDGLTIFDRARPTTAYAPVVRTYNDPARGLQTVTVFNLDPGLTTQRDRVIDNNEALRSDYDGFMLSANKRLSRGWQMLAGLTLQSHKGFAHDGTFTDPGATTDFNNPNYQLNHANSAVFTDIPWSFTMAGSYQLPWAVMVSGRYNARAGIPLRRTLLVSGLSQGAETVWVQPRGDDKTETVSRFVDLRIAKSMQVGHASVEGTVDLFNLINANHVLGQVEAIGSTIGRPNRILTPRVARFGLAMRF